MKKLLLLFILSLITQTGISQCTTSASSFGNNTNITSYNVSGDVTVTLNNNNTVTLDLGTNFQTAGGPDIRAYLVNSNGASDTALRNSKIADLDNIEFGLVGCTGCIPAIPSNGAKSFTVNIPNGKNIEDFDRVFFYCLAFDQFWDFGSFASFNATNCSSVLNIEENAFNKTSIFPNPASSIVRISSPTDALTQIRIFNALGKVVHQSEVRLNNDIDVSNLKSGIYILSAISDRQSISKKLVIK
ncbi:T9SS type A sorting domain-containing protein [Flavivirga rizhaonensis]|uniref:T9SS type A sorting domain-containing protein n=1 Tax=Flavivirga rizhaonensis TaxID=2559571 RepID=A0A4S1E0Q0_9FLAO|nr:T9SS type A sorting domain-containing protein [Flavivirga rizhaonensis]TGV04117.1 T9SS type A sorting domain-containing protein [Flavivirga rizhaonensis]